MTNQKNSPLISQEKPASSGVPPLWMKPSRSKVASKQKPGRETQPQRVFSIEEREARDTASVFTSKSTNSDEDAEEILHVLHQALRGINEGMCSTNAALAELVEEVKLLRKPS